MSNQLSAVMLLAFLALLSLPKSAEARGAARELIREFGIKTYYVTRKDSDFYEVSLQNVVIKTRYCFEFAFSSEAVITDSKLIFIDSDTVCEIEGIYNKK